MNQRVSLDGLLYYSTIPEGSRIGDQDFRDHLFEESELFTDTGTKRYGLFEKGEQRPFQRTWPPV